MHYWDKDNQSWMMPSRLHHRPGNGRQTRCRPRTLAQAYLAKATNKKAENGDRQSIARDPDNAEAKRFKRKLIRDEVY